MNPELQALLDRLGSTDNPLNAEELAALRDGLNAYFDEVSEQTVTPEVVAEMQELASHLATVDSEITAIETAAAELEAERQALIDQVRGTSAEDDGGEGEGDPPADPPAEPEGDPSADPPAEGDVPAENPVEPPVEARKAAGAKRTPLGKLSRVVPASSRPRPKNTGAVRLVAAGDVAGYSAGQPLDPEQLQLVVERKIAATTSDGTFMVASAEWDYPPERQLGMDSAENMAKIAAVTGQDALTAGGGICAPLMAVFDIFDIGATDERRIKDQAMAAYMAKRGGMRFVRPPKLGDLDAAVAQWTSDNDVTPTAPATKPIVEISCGTEQTAKVYGVPLRLSIGNMLEQFSPEEVAANTRVAMTTHARFSENLLLTAIDAEATAEGVTHVITQAALGVPVGAAPSLLYQTELIADGIRQRSRLKDTTPIRVIFPFWAKHVMRVDMAFRLATDVGTNGGALNVTDAMIDAWFRERNINITWHLDGLGTGELIAANAAAAIGKYPTTVKWRAYPEGSFLFLDGGRWDFGVVRDSATNAVNKHQLFVETLEGVAMVGIPEVYTVLSTTCASGASAGTVVAACA